MAVESWSERVTGRVTESALRLRQPARRFAGSVRAAVTIGAIIVGAYTLLIGSIYTWRPWSYREVGALLQTSSGFAFITAIMDMALIFGILVKEDKILKYILCASMAVYLVCAPLSLCTFLGTAICGYFDIPLWEMPRFGVCLVHLGLMYCLLAELRGDPLPPLTPLTPPAEGWLKNNLARAGPPAPHAADDALLKVHVVDNNSSSTSSNNNNNNNNNAAQPASRNGPAVFAPSSCTTASPVLPAYSAPAQNPAASGPPSSSDA